MNKDAFIAGFIKSATDNGLSDFDLLSLWKYACHTPYIQETLEKYSDDELDYDVEDLDTISHLININKQASELCTL
jgi:hypothetical protein